MTLDEFKKQAEAANWESSVDELCVKWLEHSTKEYGKDGRIADQLLSVIKELMDI